MKFFLHGQLQYQPPNRAIREMITKIGWEPLFSDISVFRQPFHPDANHRSILQEFLCSYDPVTKSGFVNGVQVFLTRQVVAQAFGFPSSPENGQNFKRVSKKGEATFRCDLLTKNAKNNTQGLPLQYIKDAEIKRMLQLGNSMITGKASAGSVIRFGVLRAVWESFKDGSQFDWPEFMLRTIHSHLLLAQKRFTTTGRCTLSLSQQLIAILQAGTSKECTVTMVGKSNQLHQRECIVIEDPCQVSDQVEIVPVEVLVPPSREDSVEVSPGDLVKENSPGQEEYDQLDDGDFKPQESSKLDNQHDMFEELLLLIKRTICKLLVLRSNGSSNAIEMEQQQMEEIRIKLKNLVEASCPCQQVEEQQNEVLHKLLYSLQALETEKQQQFERFQALRDKFGEPVCRSDAELENVKAENVALKKQLHNVEVENAKLKILNKSLQEAKHVRRQDPRH